jgi:hypothetical protein
MNDTDLATLVRDAVRDTHMTVPEADITRRARTLRTRRRAAIGGAATAGVAAAAVAVTALGVPAAAPASHQATGQLTAWTVSDQAGGAIDVTIRELRDPAGLRAELRADGVPASVTFSGGVNPACRDYIVKQAPFKKGQPPVIDDGLFSLSRTSADTLMVINPARLRDGEGIQISVRFGSVTGPGNKVLKNSYAVEFGPVHTSPACTG